MIASITHVDLVMAAFVVVFIVHIGAQKRVIASSEKELVTLRTRHWAQHGYNVIPLIGSYRRVVGRGNHEMEDVIPRAKKIARIEQVAL